jgi:hypothetical protein
VSNLLAFLADAILGPRCLCGQRVFPKDRIAHDAINHPGEFR